MTVNFNRRAFISTSAAALAAPLLATAWTPARAGAFAPATITSQEAGKLRVLGVTDLHYFWHPGLKDQLTSLRLQDYVDRWRPDAIVVCGDFWMENPEGRGLAYCEFAIGEIEKLGVPWAFARGNHDKVSPEDDALAREVLTLAPHSLYRGAATADNYRVEVRSAGADRPFWDLYLFNNAYPELHGFHAEQLDWFAAEASRVRAAFGDLPAFAFFHIPLIEWRTLAKSRTALGVKLEPVEIKEGSPGAFEALTRENQIRAMFCGHHHLNNYRGEYEGVHLEFLRSTGQGGYGGKTLAKGATLIELDATGNPPVLSTATVTPDGRKFSYQRRTPPRWR